MLAGWSNFESKCGPCSVIMYVAAEAGGKMLVAVCYSVRLYAIGRSRVRDILRDAKILTQLFFLWISKTWISKPAACGCPLLFPISFLRLLWRSLGLEIFCVQYVVLRWARTLYEIKLMICIHTFCFVNLSDRFEGEEGVDIIIETIWRKYISVLGIYLNCFRVV
jgi:hypothetical protein